MYGNLVNGIIQYASLNYLTEYGSLIFNFNTDTTMIDDGIKINRQNAPSDVRTIVNTKADIASMLLPFVGMEKLICQ